MKHFQKKFIVTPIKFQMIMIKNLSQKDLLILKMNIYTFMMKKLLMKRLF